MLGPKNVYRDLPYTNCGNESPQKCKCEDGSEITEEVFLLDHEEAMRRECFRSACLLELISRVQDNRWKEKVEKQRMLECLRGRGNKLLSSLEMIRELTSISLITVPGASLTISPTAIPANIDTKVSCTARIRLICR